MLRWLLMLLMATGLMGCSYNAIPVERGSLIPFEELRQNRADLPRLFERELAAGRHAEAFFVLEMMKNRPLAGLTRASARARPEGRVSDLPQHFDVVASDEGTRGLKVVPAKVKSGAKVVPLADNDNLYWEEQARANDRIAVVNERLFPFELALKSTFVVTTAEEVQRTLPEDRAMVSWFVAEDAVHAFVVTHDAVSHHQADRKAVLAATESLRMAIRSKGGDAWRKRSSTVYRLLFGPMAPELEGISGLILVPDGFLSNVPFAALLDTASGKLLLERMHLSYLPSASFRRYALNRRFPDEPPRMLALGNADYPEPFEPLPAAEVEARTLARIFPKSRARIGADVSEDAFYDAYKNFNVYHFATHGLLAGQADGRASSLVLSKGGRNDGYLTASEIAGLDLRHAYLVMLSACETSVSRGATSSGSLESISAAFLSAGAPTVVGSQWQVADASTALLMLEVYARLLEFGPAEALRKAQLALRERAPFRHPFHWAAFVAYGWDR